MIDGTNQVTGDVDGHLVQAQDISGGITVGRPATADGLTLEQMKLEVLTRMATRSGSPDPVDLAVSAELGAIFTLLQQIR